MSLQDQLLKAGLVDKKKANQIKKSKHKQARQKQKNRIGTADETRLAAEQARKEKAERDRQLNKRHRAEAEHKAIAAQVRQLIELNRQSRDDGDLAYNFTDGSLVKTVYVTRDQQRQLGKGNLCIIKHGEQYELIPKAVAEKIQTRDGGIRLFCNRSEEKPDEDDPYARYQVPDDLMW